MTVISFGRTNEIGALLAPTLGTTGTFLVGNTTIRPNYLINGGFEISQAATSATITAGTATPTQSLGYPTVDNWFAYSVGGNPTIAQVAGSGATPYRLQLTGAASITSVGIGQRIESINSAKLALKTVTLSFDCSNSLLTSLTITANRPTTANTFGTIATPTKTQIATTSLTINSTLTRYSYTFTCPQEVNLGLEILFTLGAQTSGTFVLSNVKLEEGSVSTSFVSDAIQELRNCQRYFLSASLNVGNPSYATSYTFPSTMRTTPISVGGGAGYNINFLTSFGVSHYQAVAGGTPFTFSAYIP
jgi:hypothetical protein